ncbi:ubiquitin carboxyl-terminal hydrolase 2-like [Artemia franciscana]|uniref:ubiquitin carboxyl-terminal hydrolase 2-like n=1 Tax=Artemia franciscana TaxID=6661 RepID=UPI0032DB6CBA
MSATNYSLSLNYSTNYLSTPSPRYSRNYGISPRSCNLSRQCDSSNYSSYSSHCTETRVPRLLTNSGYNCVSSRSYSGIHSSLSCPLAKGSYNRSTALYKSIDNPTDYHNNKSRASSVGSDFCSLTSSWRDRRVPDAHETYNFHTRNKLKELDINRTISDISETKVNRFSNSPAGEHYSALTPSSVNPVIDRKTKPITSQSSKYQGNGLVGMRNLGNTCYMNSALQCLLHLEDLRDYFLENYFRSDVNSNTMTQGNFAEGFADLFQSVWSGNLNCIVPTNFKKLVNAYRPDFRGNDQQDSDEFLVFLLDALHEDLNKVKKKQPMKEQENEGKTQSEASYVAFINWESSNKSKISDLFYGQEMSTLTCTTCRHSSIRFDMICALVVPIPNVVHHCRLQDCLSLYTEGESIADWNCPKCRRNSKESIKKLDLIRTPKILIVTLKRFSKDFQQWTKRQTFVEYPKTGLRINGSTYKLVATVNHFGTVNGGHYTASVYHPDLKVWHKYDDSEVSILREDDVISKEAYILFYSKLV